MQILGYIISARKINGLEDFVKQVSTIEDVPDKTKPSLLVGWNEAKQHEGYTNILNKQLSDNLYWTFGRTENRSKMEIDLKDFYKRLFDGVIQNTHYHYVNIYELPLHRLKKFLRFVNSCNSQDIYVCNDMVYIRYRQEVFGVSLRILEYCGIAKNKTLRYLSKVGWVSDTERAISKLSRALGDKKYAVPCFL